MGAAARARSVCRYLIFLAAFKCSEKGGAKSTKVDSLLKIKEIIILSF